MHRGLPTSSTKSYGDTSVILDAPRVSIGFGDFVTRDLVTRDIPGGLR